MNWDGSSCHAEGIHTGTSVTGEPLCPGQLRNSGQKGADVCPALGFSLCTLESVLLSYNWMVGSWLCWEPEACRSLPHSQEYFTGLDREEPKAVGGKQAKHSFVLREWLAQGRRWVERMPKKGSSKGRQ